MKSVNMKSSKTSDKQQNKAEVPTTSTEPNSKASNSSSNSSGESSAERDKDNTTFASGCDFCELTETQLSSVKSNASFKDKSIQCVPGQKGKRNIFCTVCLPNLTNVRHACYRGRVPPICLPE